MKQNSIRFAFVFLAIYTIFILIVSSKNGQNLYENKAVKLNFDDDETFKKLKIDDILITIKSCSQNYRNRLKIIAETWYNFARSQVRKSNMRST